MNTAVLFNLPGDINGADCTTGIGDIIYSLHRAIHMHKHAHTHAHKQLLGRPLHRPVLLKGASHKARGQKVQRVGGRRRTPLTYIIDIINNGHLTRLLNNSLTHTHRPTITFQQTYYATTCICLRLIMGGLLLASCPDPRRTVCRGLTSSMGLLYLLERKTASAKQDWHREGNSVGTWETHGRSAASSRDPTQ